MLLGEGQLVYRIDSINVLFGPQAPIIEELNMTLIIRGESLLLERKWETTIYISGDT